MEKSESIKNLALALLKFQTAVGKIPKDSNNPFFKSKYAALPDILDNIHEHLINAELVLSQWPSGNHGLTTFLIHAPTGEFMMEEYIMTPTKNDPQGIGSSITYQRRYAVGAVLSLNIDEDDDGNKASDPTPSNNNSTKEEDNRPWLSEKQLTDALARIQKGEQGVYEKVDAAFKMKKEYRAQLKG